jgi:hypothetical protein
MPAAHEQTYEGDSLGTAFYINFRKKTLDNIKTARKA